MNAHKSLKKWSDFDKCFFEAYFLRGRSLVYQLLVLYSEYSEYIQLYSVLTLWHTFVHSHSNSGSKKTHYRLKNGYIF